MRTDDSTDQPHMSTESSREPPQHARVTFTWSLLWLLWVPFFIPSLVSLANAHASPARVALSLAGTIVFIVLYVRTAWESATRLANPIPQPETSFLKLWAPLIIMLFTATALFLANGLTWGGFFFFSSAALAGRLPWRQTILGLLALALLLTIAGRQIHAQRSDGVSALLMICIIGLAVTTVKQSIARNQELRAEREHLARFSAVMEERLRIARDLHDLLGHNLSLIALKSELARRLIDASPQRAASEIADIEQVARTALHEVRQTVSRYRQPTLMGELRGAADILGIAGITCHCDADKALIGTLPAATDGVLAWTVREAVTNVIRHSHASHCRISVVVGAGRVRLEILDDGSGMPYEPAGTEGVGQAGNGLRGLAERVAPLGGSLEAGQRPNGGFQLTVSVPLVPGGVENVPPLPSGVTHSLS